MTRMYITATEFRGKPFGIPLRQFNDTTIEDYIAIATSNVEDFTERVWTQQSYTEKFRGDGSTTFLTHEYPLTTVTSLIQTDPSGPDTTYNVSHLVRTSINDMVGRIELDGLDTAISTFSPSYFYTVIYTAGFTDIPPAIKHATGLWTAQLLAMDYANAQGQAPEIIALSDNQISELLIPRRRRRI